jgi:hypothetical protein
MIHTNDPDLEALLFGGEALALKAEDQIAEERRRKAGLNGFKLGLMAGLGSPRAEVVHDDLFRRHRISDSEIARRLGLSRSTINKTCRMVRRNLNWPLRVPNNAAGSAALRQKLKQAAPLRDPKPTTTQ